VLCSETVGEGVGGSTSARLATPKCDRKQLNLCQACNSAANYTHLSLGYMLYHQYGLKDISGRGEI